MKKFLTVCGLGLALSFNSFGQKLNMGKDYYATPEKKSSSLYLGFGTGINNYLGMIGPSIEYQFAPKFTVFGGAGLGSWGSKVSAGVRYYGNFPSRWAFGLGYSHASGIEKIEFDLPAQYVVDQTTNVKVPFKLKGANTVNLSANQYWMLGKARKNRFNIELGYAFSLADNQFDVQNGYELTYQGKNFMNLMQPGGLILGLGFSFALN